MKVTIAINLNKETFEVKNEEDAVEIVEQLIREKKYQIVVTDENNNAYIYL